MERLPSDEERQWLANALRTLIARNELLDATPLVQPANDWFPEPWAATAAHGHRLAQRMMHYAGLGTLRLALSAYEPDEGAEDAWDVGTAGWFAGIDEGRAYFGLHVDQFLDPEAAAGVLAHEVAHAWRTHHRLTVDDRDEEELLTDVTTVVLGFGILSTNNTDRYRSAGDWNETRWTISSAGYLPPQSMAYLLALWMLARGKAGERKIIERHLEPNQLGFFRAALDELAGTDVRALLGAGAPVAVREPAPFVPREPAGDEISEPEYEEQEEIDLELIVVPEEEPRAEAPAPSSRFPRVAAVLVVLALIATTAVAWWRQNHVPVYFDNALGRRLTLQVDGETFPLKGRPPLMRELKPGRHRIVIIEGKREIETFDAEVRRQNLFRALVEPTFYVYNTGGAGIYRRAQFVYAERPDDQDYDEALIAFERWIAQAPADFVFTAPPEELSLTRGSTKKRTSFEIVDDFGFRELAIQWHSEGRTDDAIRALRKGVELKPCDETMYGELVSMLDHAGHAETALSEATKWVKLCGEESIPAHRLYQYLAVRDGDETAVRREYALRLARQPTAVNHYLFGRLFDGEEALEEYRFALRLDPKLTWARAGMGHELLAMERDAEAYDVLAETLTASDAPPNAPVYFAMAAVALQKQDAAREKLVAAEELDTWEGRWILARSKGDWDSARIYISDKEQGESTPRTKVLRARVEWEAGGTRENILAGLRSDPETAYDAELLAIEDALEHDRAAEALAIDEKLRAKHAPSVHSVYAIEAAMLAKLPDVAEKANALRGELRGDLLPLLDAAEGRIDETTLMERIDDARMKPHAWFALAVHASTQGDRAKAARYFRKASERALDFEFARRVGTAYLHAFSNPRAQASL